MAGDDNTVAHGTQSTHPGDVSAAETTSIAMPPRAAAAGPSVQPKLSPEEQAAVAALPAGSALLIAHSGPNAGARFLLDQDIVAAGRHPNADVFLDDVTVSRRHAEFRKVPSGYELVDTHSLNGTYVNQDRVDHVVLRHGYDVQIGKFRLTYYLSPAGTSGGAQGQA